MIQKRPRDELLDQFDRLSPDEQQRVIDFARKAAALVPRGVRGADLLKFAGTLAAGEAVRMNEAIHADCEQIDRHAW